MIIHVILNASSISTFGLTYLKKRFYLIKLKECECKGLVKRLFSYHNYLFDIDLKSILDISHNFGKHDFNKCTKLNINKLNYDSWNLFELKNNLFLMLKHLLVI